MPNPINISVVLLESNTQIKNKILKAITEDLNRLIPPVMNRIEARIRAATFIFFQQTETYYSLVNGELAGHFGIPSINRQHNIDTILKTIANNMEIEYEVARQSAGQIKGGITVRVLMRDFSDLFGLPQATIITKNGDLLDWLRWLLAAGDKIIIKEWDIDLGIGEGRSGMGVMVPSTAGAWRVPPEFAGTITNNWLTRALSDNANRYLSIIQTIIEDELKRI